MHLPVRMNGLGRLLRRRPGTVDRQRLMIVLAADEETYGILIHIELDTLECMRKKCTDVDQEIS